MLRQAFQSFLVHVRRTFWGETTLLGKRRNFSSFLEFEQTVLRILTRIFRQGGHNRILRAQMKFFWRKEVKENLFFSENFALLSTSNFERKKSLILLQASLRQACQNFVVHVQTKIFTNNFFGRLINFSSFPEIQQKFFRVLTRKFLQGGHNFIIHVHRNIFRKVIFLSKSSMFFPWFSESELPICGL